MNEWIQRTHSLDCQRVGPPMNPPATLSLVAGEKKGKGWKHQRWKEWSSLCKPLSWHSAEIRSNMGYVHMKKVKGWVLLYQLLRAEFFHTDYFHTFINRRTFSPFGPQESRCIFLKYWEKIWEVFSALFFRGEVLWMELITTQISFQSGRLSWPFPDRLRFGGCVIWPHTLLFYSM